MPEKNKNIHLTVRHKYLYLEKNSTERASTEHKSVSKFAEDKVALEQVFFPFPSISVINFQVIHPTALQLESEGVMADL
jgi:hypothetical protein